MSRRGDIFIVGTGGHAKEVAEMALELDMHPVLVAHTKADAESVIEWDVVVQDDWVSDERAVAIAVGEPAIRKAISERFPLRVTFPNLIHPDSSIGTSLRPRLAEAVGLQIFAGARLTTNIRLGQFVIINQNATVGHDCIIGDFVTIAPGANVSGAVKLGERVWVGTGAAINQGATDRHLCIGDGVVIGSGAVVIDDCEAESVYVGVPAKRLI